MLLDMMVGFREAVTQAPLLLCCALTPLSLVLDVLVDLWPFILVTISAVERAFLLYDWPWVFMKSLLSKCILWRDLVDLIAIFGWELSRKYCRRHFKTRNTWEEAPWSTDICTVVSPLRVRVYGCTRMLTKWANSSCTNRFRWFLSAFTVSSDVNII